MIAFLNTKTPATTINNNAPPITPGTTPKNVLRTLYSIPLIKKILYSVIRPNIASKILTLSGANTVPILNVSLKNALSKINSKI